VDDGGNEDVSLSTRVLPPFKRSRLLGAAAIEKPGARIGHKSLFRGRQQADRNASAFKRLRTIMLPLMRSGMQAQARELWWDGARASEERLDWRIVGPQPLQSNDANFACDGTLSGRSRTAAKDINSNSGPESGEKLQWGIKGSCGANLVNGTSSRSARPLSRGEKNRIQKGDSCLFNPGGGKSAENAEVRKRDPNEAGFQRMLSVHHSEQRWMNPYGKGRPSVVFDKQRASIGLT